MGLWADRDWISVRQRAVNWCNIRTHFCQPAGSKMTWTWIWARQISAQSQFTAPVAGSCSDVLMAWIFFVQPQKFSDIVTLQFCIWLLSLDCYYICLNEGILLKHSFNISAPNSWFHFWLRALDLFAIGPSWRRLLQFLSTVRLCYGVLRCMHGSQTFIVHNRGLFVVVTFIRYDGQFSGLESVIIGFYCILRYFASI